jgi:hypothetical protein
VTENTAKKQHRGRPWQKGQSGNPAGKPKGTRHHATRLAEQLLDSEAEGLTRKAVELALAGDTTALRMCLDRLVPPRRDRFVSFRLPPIKSSEDAVTALAAIATAVADGDVTPGEAAELSALVSTIVRTIEATELENRVRALEEAR